ncbi:PAS domain S-box protein [Kamptonema animale CS-326]|uniref:PAS domain S-box protein n=1 Tax=Kamptonema animale TaxID=92934 RepID=UPI002330AD19|nr:PAS domain S-box protein [Kamptonema animale]MDB9513323.1 PAS domain S-box protein [Kamptonema animale CS-326]
MYRTIETLQQRVKFLEAEITQLLDSRKSEVEQQVLERTVWQQQVKRERLLGSMAWGIRQSLNLEEILSGVVKEVRNLLQCDRVVVYQFGSTIDGTIVAESVAPGWSQTLGNYIPDTCWQENQALKYRWGHKQAIADISQAGFKDCHRELLERLQIRAQLSVPISIARHFPRASQETQKSPPLLWGLLFANQCSAPRLWRESELELLDELGVQIAIAIQQNCLFGELQTELTKRQQLEIALTESEERFRSIANSLPVLLWMSDPTGERNFFNQTWLNFTGRTLEQEINHGWMRGLHPEDCQKAVETYFSAFHQRQSFQIEYRFRRADGKYRWLLDKGAPRFSPDGSFAGYIGSCIDITDRKWAEDGLYQSERLYATLTEVSPVGFFRTDVEGKNLYSNERSCEIAGLEPGESVGYGWTKNLHPDDRDRVLAEWHQAIQTEEIFSSEYRFLRPDGTVKWVFGQAVAEREDNGTVVSYIGTITDISDRKQAEAKLQTAYQQLTFHVENSPLAVIEWDKHFRVKRWSKQAEKIFGWREEEVLGLHPNEWSIVFVDEIESVNGVVSRLLTGSESRNTSHNRNYTKEGAVIYCDWYNSVLFDSAENLISIQSLVQDVSDRKRAETALQHLAGELEIRVQERTQELASTVKLLQQEIAEREQAQKELLVLKERLQYLLSASPTVIYSCKAEGNYATTFISDNIAVLLGYKPTDFIEESSFWINGIHPEDVPRIFNEMMSNFGGSKHILEYRFLDAFGNYVWLQNDLTLVRDSAGNPLEIVGSMIDITAKKLAESALVAAKEQLQAVIDAVPGFVSWIGADLRFLGVNRQLALMFNLSPDTFVGKEIGFINSNFNYTDFISDFFTASDTSTSQEITLALANDRLLPQSRTYLVVAQKYNQEQAAIFVGIDITERKQGEEQIKASLKEKEVLLKEIHHRVKNNLQIISSLLKLQSKYIKDPESMVLFLDSYNRIRSMALIHENLYRTTDLARINTAEYIRKLVSNLSSSYGCSSRLIEVKLEIESICLDIDTAIPCGLIINELVSNAFKYAFPQGRKGKILVSFKLENNTNFVLRVSDSGVGFPENFDWEETESLGLQLVVNLTEQLGGNIELDRSRGTDFQVYFAKSTRTK